MELMQVRYSPYNEKVRYRAPDARRDVIVEPGLDAQRLIAIGRAGGIERRQGTGSAWRT